jgi:hypothetical protein
MWIKCIRARDSVPTPATRLNALFFFLNIIFIYLFCSNSFLEFWGIFTTTWVGRLIVRVNSRNFLRLFSVRSECHQNRLVETKNKKRKFFYEIPFLYSFKRDYLRTYSYLSSSQFSNLFFLSNFIWFLVGKESRLDTHVADEDSNTLGIPDGYTHTHATNSKNFFNS